MSLSGSNNEQKIWNYLISKGFSEYGSAGLMGNLYAESGLSPTNLQNSYESKLGYTDASYTNAVDNGSYTNFVRDSAGYGLAQWTYWSRKQGLLDYAKSIGKSIGDLEMQLDYLYKEISGYTSVFNVLKNASSVLEASNAVLFNYERPANQSASVQSKRASYGQGYYEKYATNHSIGQSSPTENSSASSESSDDIIYTVVKGDTLSSIASRYNTTYQKLAEYNNIPNPSKISVGQQIIIPSNIGTNDNKESSINTNKALQYTNSSLVSYTKISPNKTCQRNHAIDTITIHCVVGQCTVERLGDIFSPTSKQASSNYGVGYDGKIGMYVEEKDRSWCSSNSANDNRAITIEVASDTKEPYAVTEKAYAALLDLVTDICKRNNIKELKWKADKSLVGQVDKQNMTVHRWFANKSCPGTYLYNKHYEIAAEVNKRLGATSSSPSSLPEQAPSDVSNTATVNSIGEIVNFIGDTHYSNSNASNGTSCKPGMAKITAIANGTKHPYHLVRESNSESTVHGWVDINDIAIPSINGQSHACNFTSYTVKVTAGNLNIRQGAGTNYPAVGFIKDKGIYTITEESDGVGATKWGKLGSGKGWISLDYCQRL